MRKLSNCIDCKWRRCGNKCGNPNRFNFREEFIIPYIAHNDVRYDCPKNNWQKARQLISEGKLSKESTEGFIKGMEREINL